jgi:hypothetical protein
VFDFEACEERAGHQLTLLQGMMAGVSTYYCERCGALLQIGGSASGLLLFHAPPGSGSTPVRCEDRSQGLKGPSLKEKLKILQDMDYERLLAWSRGEGEETHGG